MEEIEPMVKTTKAMEHDLGAVPIIMTVSALIEYYMPWILGLFGFLFMASLVIEAMKEFIALAEIQPDLDLEIANVSIIFGPYAAFIYWFLGRWAQKNKTKIEGEKEENETN